MKKGNIILLAIIAIFALILVMGVSSYNKVVGLHETVEKEYSNISVQLERRADLIPNLVNTVKGYTDHENEVLDKITEARKSLLSANTIEEKAEANEQLTKALNSLNVIVENYPDLKSSQNYISLQDELAGTENRIATSRRDYNEAVSKYNTAIKKFPTVIFANMAGYKTEAYFEADESKQEVPVVDFSK